MNKGARSLAMRRRAATTLRPGLVESLESRVHLSANGWGALHSMKLTIRSMMRRGTAIEVALAGPKKKTAAANLANTTPATNTLTTSQEQAAPPLLGGTLIQENLTGSLLSVPPAPPTALVGLGISMSQIHLSWIDNSTNETGFKLERYVPATAAWMPIASLRANITSYTDSGLTASRGYNYRIRAINAGGESANSIGTTTWTTSLPPAPFAPVNLIATPLGTSAITLAWTDASLNETGFEVFRSPAGAAQWQRLGTLKANASSYSDETLAAGTSYDYRVRSINLSGGSDFATVSAATAALPPAPVPGASQMRLGNYLTAKGELAWDGFTVKDIVVARAGVADDPGTTIRADNGTVTQLNATTWLATFRTPGSEATIQARLINEGNDRRVDVTVTAGAQWVVKTITLGAPHIYAPASDDLKVFHPFQGGRIQPWYQGGWTAEGAAGWPNMDYSPMAIFYNQKTGEGAGFVSFDGGLEQRTVYWVTSPTEVHPYTRWEANIAPGQSQSTTLHVHHGFNMPNAQFTFYRDNFLKPFMNSLGIAEGSVNLGKVMAYSDGAQVGQVANYASKAVALGASSYLQYAPGDGGAYYEPNPQTLWWYPSLPQASQVPGLNTLGVLINPLMKSRTTSPTTDPTSPLWFPGGGGPQSLADPDVQRFLERLKNDLVRDGVNFAFWDTGTSAPRGERKLWFELLKSWKQAGISIAAETACDLASYATGTNLFSTWQDGKDYTMIKAITPQAKILFVDYDYHATNGVYWWNKASALGFVPMLTLPQMELWSAQQAH